MMKKERQYIFTIIFVLELIYFVETRPQFKNDSLSQSVPEIFTSTLMRAHNALNAPSPHTQINSTSMVKRVENYSLSSELENRKKSKTRILFKGNASQNGSIKDVLDQEIIFPDTYQVIFEHNIPKIDGQPKCAKTGTFCEETDLYPRNLVQNILKQKHVSNVFFGQDDILDDDKFDISNRNGADIEQYVCVGIQKTIFPTLGKNKNNKWKFIINQGETDGYIQGIRVEVCGREGSPCAIVGEIPDGYITKCKQKYISRRLMSLTDHGDPIPDTFMLPSACCCSYKKDLGFLARFGTPHTTVIDLFKRK